MTDPRPIKVRREIQDMEIEGEQFAQRTIHDVRREAKKARPRRYEDASMDGRDIASRLD